MSTENFPTLTRDSPSELSEWALVSNTFKHESPYTKSVDTVALPGARWAFGARWRNLGFTDRATFEAWLSKLNGQAGRFYFSHPMWTVPRGTARGTGTCAAAAQLATSLVLTGAGIPNGATLLEGDFIEVALTPVLLVRVVDPATAAAGSITVNVRPMLRAAVPGATAFTLVTPRAQFMLINDRQGLPVLPGPGGRGLADFEINAIEAF